MIECAKKGTPEHKRGPAQPSDKLRKRMNNDIVAVKKRKPKKK